MKRYLSALILLLSGYLSATTVTGTIQDINGNRYANGTVSAFSVITGASMTPAATDANGTFSITLSPSTYTFTVCAKPVNIGPSTSTSVTQVCAQPATPIVISGGSQDVSTQINAVAPILGPSVAAFLGANNAFTGANTHAGLETFNGQVALNNILTGSGSAAIAGTFGGSPIMTGNWTMQGNNSFAGSNTFCKINGEVVVDPTNVCGWAGTDYGAWVTAAAVAAGSNGVVAVAQGSYTQSTDIVITTPLTLMCPSRNCKVNYTGSGKMIKLGPDGLTIVTRSAEPYIVDGFDFTGGATATHGIYHNRFVIKSYMLNNRFLSFGNINAYNIFYQAENWYSHLENVYMWSESGGPCYNGIIVNDVAADNTTYDNGDSFVRMLGVHLQNLSQSCHGVGINVNSFQADFNQVDVLGGFDQLVRLRKGANKASFIDFYGETINTNAGVCGIMYGDLGTDPAAATINYIDALTVGPTFFINVHNTDFATTAHAFCPSQALAGLQNANLQGVTVLQSTAGQPVVVQNNNASQVGNSASFTRYATGSSPLPFGAATGATLHTQGGSITRWSGTDEQLTSYGDLLVNGQNGSYGATFRNLANAQNYIRVDSGSNADQDSGIEFDSQLVAKASVFWSQAGSRLTMSYGGTAFFQGNASNTFLLKPVASYGGTATVGAGVVPVYGATTQRAETTTADANVLTFTPPATAGTYRVCAMVSVSSATAGVISWTLSWTDSNGAAQANIAQNLVQQGTAAPNTTFTTSAAGNYNGCSMIDVNNGAAAIVVKWVGGGTTAAKMSASIERVI